jgi:bifunctional NMN adenylyltransferase/nudix hydrolase
MIFDGLNLSVDDALRVNLAPLQDISYNDQKWAAGVQNTVADVIAHQGWTEAAPKIGLIGHIKDSSSYYLKLFPQWELVEHNMNEVISATDLRSIMFEGKNIKFLSGLLPSCVYEEVVEFTKTDTFAVLVEEYDHIEKYKTAWKAAPYAVNLVTVDACVVQSGHVLLVTRGAYPGKNLLALPGGYLDTQERVVDGMIRELREETKLKVPDPVLRGSVKFTKVYDNPARSLRGRVITHAYLIELPGGNLPPVKGSDDAAKATWVPLSFVEAHPELFFEDHYHIIQDLTGKT